MPIVKAGQSRQVVIPKEVWDKFGLEPGDYFEVEAKQDQIVFIPKKLVRREDLWYWSKQWQAKEREADEAIAKGEVLGPFKTAKAALQALKKAKP